MTFFRRYICNYDKILANSDSADISRDFINDTNMMEVESGIEALEDNLDGFGVVPNTNIECPQIKPQEHITAPTLMPSNFGLPPSKSNLYKPNNVEQKSYFFNFTMYFLTFLLFLNYVLFPNAHAWNGFLLGIWFFCLGSNLKNWLLDNYFSDNDNQKKPFIQLKRSSAMPPTYTIPSVKEHRPLKKYEVKLFFIGILLFAFNT